MKKIIKYFLVICMVLPLSTQASEKNNYMGIGMGFDQASSGYAFVFQFQQSKNGALGFAIHEGDLITFTYKAYTEKYARSPFVEGGLVMAGGASAPVLGVGFDAPMSDTNSLSLTAAAVFTDIGVFPVARIAMLFKL